ncbi:MULTISPECIES: beta-L-arabinofuranosidase domain-containing protein [Paenibacillus]|nr:beta-L-arabinofuranosidase domain-containing protein [Paenibacillus rhizosphaerae]
MTRTVINREPLATTPYMELPLGSIQPAGWLKDQLEIQRNGLTGHLDEFWSYVGPDNGWLGGRGDSWERGPYYLDGLLPLAYLLGDEELIEKVQPWIEWTLSSSRADGQFGPETNDDWWSRMIMLKVLIQHADYTGDPRVETLMTAYFRYQLQELPKRPLSEWAKARGGENLISIQWLYNRTGENFLLELMELIRNQTMDWSGLFRNYPYWNRQTAFDHRVHVVNVAMSFKEPALAYLLTKDPEELKSVYQGIQSVMTYHGQLSGMFSGDEWLAGTHPSQGTELCAVVEYMYTLEHLIRITGDGSFGDVLEKVAFNALPAAISPDWKVHQYDQQANQIMCTHAKRNWTENNNEANLFGIEPHFGCCTANMHQGWPKFAARLWMATEDNGLAAVSYAPCTVTALVADGQQVSIQVTTEYPFKESIKMALSLDQALEFPVKLRIPGWCLSPVVKINGQAVEFSVVQGFAAIHRCWNDGDSISLELPMSVSTVTRANGAVGLQRGPLMYVIPVKERWQRHRIYEPYHDWEIYPESPWNYGLHLNLRDPGSSVQVNLGEVTYQPFMAKHAPVRLKVYGRRIPEWTMEMNSAGTVPVGPVRSKEPDEQLELIPYGCARLRIAEYPVLAD